MFWSELVMLNGVDVSARVVADKIEVDLEEGAQGVAVVSLVALSGAQNLDTLRGQTITISYQVRDITGAVLNTYLLFTGWVDLPAYNPAMKVITLNCIDRLDDRIALLSKSSIDALTPAAKWSSVIFNANADSYEYAQDRLSTLPGALDCQPDGTIVYTPWAVASPTLTLATADIVDGDPPVAVEVAPASTLRNKTVLVLTYRYEISYQREATSGWNYGRTTCQHLQAPVSLPNKEMAQRAAEGVSGWLVRSVTFTQLWASGVYTCGIPGSPISFVNNSPNTIIGYTAIWVKRWAQSIDEQFTVTLSSSNSISTYGERRGDRTSDMQTDFDIDNYEGPNANNKAVALAVVGSDGGNGGSAVGNSANHPPRSGSALNSWNDWRKEETDRTTWQAWFEAEIAIASVEHLASHRKNRATFVLPLSPSVTVQKTLRVADGSSGVAGVTCTGKVRACRHIMEASTGRAVTEVELAISRGGSAGSSSALTAPSAPSYAPTAPGTIGTVHASGNQWGGQNASPAFNPNLPGFSSNYIIPANFATIYSGTDPETEKILQPGAVPLDSYENEANAYPVEFIIIADNIEAAVRDNQTMSNTASYEVAPPHDELVIAA